MIKIAITGGIASGKSELSTFLRDKDEVLIDLDEISHHLTDNNSDVINDIVQQFGQEVKNSNGSVNRKKISEIVFDDSQKMLTLEKILHPRIREVMFDEINSCKNERVFVEVQLLAEKKMADLFDHIVLMSVSRKTQIERLKNERAMSKDLVNQILDKQLSNEERIESLKKFSLFTIDNNSSKEKLVDKFEDLYKKLINL